MSEIFIYELYDWIDVDKLNWTGLSSNPNAVGLLEQNLDKILWYALSKNENAIQLLEKYPENK
jgi:hypothetical protein